MNESGNHHSQQTDRRTEIQTPHVLTHRQALNNENMSTQRVEHHTLGSVGGTRSGTVVGRGWGGIIWGEMPGIDDGNGGSKPPCHVYTYASILHNLHMYPRT